MIVLIVLVFLWILLIFHASTRYTRRGRLAEKITGPTPLPIVGNLLSFNVSPDKIWNIAKAMHNKFYPIARFWLFSLPIISIRHPDDLEVVLSNETALQKGFWYRYMQPLLKTGLLTSMGEKWRRRRKILTPALSTNYLKKYNEITLEEADRLIDYLKSEGRESVQDLISFCSQYTLDIMCKAVMGVSLDRVDEEEVRKFEDAILQWRTIALYRVTHPYVPDWMIRFIPGLNQAETLKTLHSFTKRFIDERREFHKSTYNLILQELDSQMKGTSQDEDYPCMNRKRQFSMLDLLLVAEKNGHIDADGIQEEVDTFLYEGHEKNATALAFTLLLLAENEEAQEKARDEILELMDGNDAILETAGLRELNYLERCIKEALRLFPPVTMIQHHTKEDLQLKNALVAAKTPIITNIFDAHRDRNFWSSPDKFDPDRFLPENTRDRHPFAYVPFSAGPRDCIGQKFAMMELKSLVSHILYNFHLEPVDSSKDVQIVADLFMRTTKDIQIKFVKIDKWIM